MFMRSLSRGAFGIEFTDDGTESADNINGLEYLREVEIVSSEGPIEIGWMATGPAATSMATRPVSITIRPKTVTCVMPTQSSAMPIMA